MGKQIAILHYASAPTVGGVEATITAHALGLTRLGYKVRVISGAGDVFHPDVDVRVHPLFGSKHTDILQAKASLDTGIIPDNFEALITEITDELQRAVAGCDICIAHNIPTFNKNLPLTTALERIARKRTVHVIAWCHDLAWTNSQYTAELHDGYPWDLLRRVWENTTYVTVSEARRPELAHMLNISEDSITVVVPGVDPSAFFSWTPTMSDLDARLHFMDADALMLTPARLTRRKNIELSLHILAETRRQSARDYRLIVTGPPGPHNPTNPGYLGELLVLRDSLRLGDAAHFIYAYGQDGKDLIPDDATMANFYNTCDALLFSTLQEGFGIPMLEAGLAGIPIFCADIPPLRKTAGENAHYFDPVNGLPVKIAADVIDVLENSPVYRLRVHVRQRYRWEALIRKHLLPLLEVK
jgi:glycosyltransferase involved in cell wall biosynthesis